MKAHLLSISLAKQRFGNLMQTAYLLAEKLSRYFNFFIEARQLCLHYKSFDG
jgi:hypothetical protein